jgi:hypothetical protein
VLDASKQADAALNRLATGGVNRDATGQA